MGWGVLFILAISAMTALVAVILLIRDVFKYEQLSLSAIEHLRRIRTFSNNHEVYLAVYDFAGDLESLLDEADDDLKKIVHRGTEEL